MEVMKGEGGAGVPEERRENGGGFDWSGFFKNPYILLQIVLYVYLFYTKLPGLDELSTRTGEVDWELENWGIGIYSQMFGSHQKVPLFSQTQE
ncbi:unnamed protein product [Miscanthus lutarioriparius]|uniref:Uncharacterized protein n=1 Tax=Miscanthus lutarioriparius TaxID=422564 RepID=A0A811QFM4_9POAL|nr:unnamed protein product [Miscanthus lutarioriparius]